MEKAPFLLAILIKAVVLQRLDRKEYNWVVFARISFPKYYVTLNAQGKLALGLQRRMNSSFKSPCVRMSILFPSSAGKLQNPRCSHPERHLPADYEAASYDVTSRIRADGE